MIYSVTAPPLADSYLIKILPELVSLWDMRAARKHYWDESGWEMLVLDRASGFGALIFGRNNPEIVAHTKALLDAQIPMHAQVAGYSRGIDVAAALNDIRRDTRTDDRYAERFRNVSRSADQLEPPGRQAVGDHR